MHELFNPKTVAIVGQSHEEKSIAHGILKNLLKGGVFGNKHCKPFPGKTYVVNPEAEYVSGLKSFPSLLRVPDQIDLALLCTSAKDTMQVVKDCIKKKTKNIILLSSEFSEMGEAGKKLEQKIVEIAKKAKVKILGPNAFGIIRPAFSLNASTAPTMPKPGSIALISSSGGIINSVLGKYDAEKFGFSVIAGYGSGADIEVEDFFEFLQNDFQTKVVALCIEDIRDGQKFLTLAKQLNKVKPVVVLKIGATFAGKVASKQHSGNETGDDTLYDAAFKQAGLISVNSVEDLLNISNTLACMPPCQTNNIFVITNSGGLGILAADYLTGCCIKLAEPKAALIKKLSLTKRFTTMNNPLDISNDALPEKYNLALSSVLSEDNVGGVLVIQTMQTMTDAEETAKTIITNFKTHPTKPVITVGIGGIFSDKAALLLNAEGIPDFEESGAAAKALTALVKRGEYLKH